MSFLYVPIGATPDQAVPLLESLPPGFNRELSVSPPPPPPYNLMPEIVDDVEQENLVEWFSHASLVDDKDVHPDQKLAAYDHSSLVDYYVLYPNSSVELDLENT
jgi:hypothetical protein